MRIPRIAADVVVVACAAACAFGVPSCTCSGGRPAAQAAAPIRFWHTFSPRETEALNDVIARRPAGAAPVEVSLIPFSRGMTLLHRVLGAGVDCPDLARIDALWLPGLAQAGLLAPAPPKIAAARAWLPEAKAFTRYRGTTYALPQSLDGLALVYRPANLADAGASFPPPTLGDLIADAHGLTGEGRFGLGVHVDGYWFIAFLRASGGRIPSPHTDVGLAGIDNKVAAAALTRFAELFGPDGVAPAPPADGARQQARQFKAGKLAVVMTGPWAAYALAGGAPDKLAVAPFPPGPDGHPAAPRGAQLFVVPKCARNRAGAWKLALALTAPALQADWGRRFGVVPTTRGGLAAAGAFSQAFYRALQHARPLPRLPITADLFDDLTPAVAAVVAGDATANEALAGVARAWTRIDRRDAARASAHPQSHRDAGARARPGRAAARRDAGASPHRGGAGPRPGDRR